MSIDPTTIMAALTVAGQAAGTAEKGVSLAKALSGLFGRSEASGDVELKAAIAELTLQAADTALANAKLKAELAEIHNAAEKAQKFEGQLARYELHRTEGGGLLYRLKATDKSGEPPHSICPNCVEAGHKSILQGDGYFLGCPKCGASIPNKKPIAKQLGVSGG
jgi:hypothetical protein